MVNRLYARTEALFEQWSYLSQGVFGGCLTKLDRVGCRVGAQQV